MKIRRQGEMHTRGGPTASCCHVMESDSVTESAITMCFSGQEQGGEKPDIFKVIGFPQKRKILITLKIQIPCCIYISIFFTIMTRMFGLLLTWIVIQI